MVRLALLALVPLLLGSGDAARYRLTTVDGAVVLIDGPVANRDGVLVFRGAEGGLASISEAAVASIEPVETAPSPAVGAESEPDAETVSDAGADAAQVVTNEDLPPPLEPWTTLARPVVDDDAAETLTYDTYLDRSGRGEAWWRERASSLRVEVDAAREALDAAQRDYAGLAEAWGVLPPREWPTPGSARLRMALREAAARRDAAADRLDEADAALAALEEEARTAGALPGWLR